MTQAVHQGPRAEVPEGTQYLLGRSYAAALELDPDGNPAAVGFRVRIALRIVDRIEATCGWTDAVRAGFRAGAVFDPLGDVDAARWPRHGLTAMRGDSDSARWAALCWAGGSVATGDAGGRVLRLEPRRGDLDPAAFVVGGPGHGSSGGGAR